MPISTLGKLHQVLGDHLVIDVEVKTGSGRRVHVGDVDSTALFSIFTMREPHTHVRPVVGEDWPESRRGSLVS